MKYYLNSVEKKIHEIESSNIKHLAQNMSGFQVTIFCNNTKI